VSRWPATRASRVLAALQRIGWALKREAGGSRKVFAREGYPDFVWAFHDREEIGPRMLARIAKRTGLAPDDLWQGRGTRGPTRAPRPGADPLSDAASQGSLRGPSA
jgi:predicted RNA binding protein YcfA (HicA-like mRNA interferase family)